MVCLPAGTAVSELLCRPCRPCYLNPAAAFQRESDPSALDGFPVFSGTVFRGGRRSFRRGKRGWGCDLLTTELQSVKSEAGLDTRAPGAPGAWGVPSFAPRGSPGGHQTPPPTFSACLPSFSNVPGPVLDSSHRNETCILALKFSGKLNSDEELAYSGVHGMPDTISA